MNRKYFWKQKFYDISTDEIKKVTETSNDITNTPIINVQSYCKTRGNNSSCSVLIAAHIMGETFSFGFTGQTENYDKQKKVEQVSVGWSKQTNDNFICYGYIGVFSKFSNFNYHQYLSYYKRQKVCLDIFVQFHPYNSRPPLRKLYAVKSKVIVLKYFFLNGIPCIIHVIKFHLLLPFQKCSLYTE